MPQSFSQLHTHFVFSTKDRRPWLDAELRPHLFEYVGGTLRGMKCACVIAGGVADHIHFLCDMSRVSCPADLIEALKPALTGWIRDQDRKYAGFSWQSGYGAFSVGLEGIEIVRDYIATQEEHHKKERFQDEYRRFLDERRIPYDERYMWD